MRGGRLDIPPRSLVELHAIVGNGGVETPPGAADLVGRAGEVCLDVLVEARLGSWEGRRTAAESSSNVHAESFLTRVEGYAT